ncbi:delta-1-pyrroline-5-carboxylate synthase-like protein, partial [Tanacetum coccineum]
FEEELFLEKKSCPLGVLLLVFESRPNALVQIASLAIRSRNDLLLKWGKEAKRLNAIPHKICTIDITRGNPRIAEDLVIPRGNNKLVSQMKKSTKILVLGHSGNIHFQYSLKQIK